MKYVTDYDINSMYADLSPLQVVGYTNWTRVGIWTPTEWPVYRVLEPVGDWIENNAEDMWIEVPEARQGFMRAYALSPELESWFQLRWS